MNWEVILTIMSGMAIAWLGYQQVRGKNQGEAIQATAESVVKLSKRVDELEREKATIADQLQSVKTESEQEKAAFLSEIRLIEKRSRDQQVALTTERDHLRRQVSDFSERLTFLSRELKNQQAVLDNQREQIASMLDQLLAKDRMIERMDAEIKRLSVLVADLRARLAKYEEVP